MNISTEIASSFSLEKSCINTHEALQYIFGLCHAHNKLLLLDRICLEYNIDPHSVFCFKTQHRMGKSYRFMLQEEAALFFQRIIREDQPIVYVSNNRHSMQLLFDNYGDQSLKLTKYQHNSPPQGSFSPSSLITGISEEIREWHKHPVERKILLEKLEQETAITRFYKAQARIMEANASVAEAKALREIQQISENQEDSVQLLDCIEVKQLERPLPEQTATLTEVIKQVKVPQSIQTALPNYIEVKEEMSIQAKRFYYNQVGVIYDLSMDVRAKLDTKV